MTWTERAADRSPSVQRSKTRSVEQARQIVEAAQRLLASDDTGFTTHELAKEAGVAIQTFYRYFGGKDELLLAVLEETIADGCARMAEQAAALDDPLDRLRMYTTGSLMGLADESSGVARFITAEHYRLHQLFPDELAAASQRFADLLVPEIGAAAAAGALDPGDVQVAAWHVTQQSMATFHHYAFATPTAPIEDIADELWSFCLRALGGQPAS